MRPEAIADTLRRAIRERVLVPGQALNQDDLARRFGVSRIPLREALRTLAGEGLVLIQPGLGAVVVELDADEVEELYSLRLQLEPPLARTVAQLISVREIDELETLTRRMEETTKVDPEEWSALHYAFRRRLYELSGRAHAVRLVTQVLNLVEPYSRYHAHVLGAKVRVGEELGREIAAMRERDGDGLYGLVADSINRVREALVEAMRQSPRDERDLAGLFGRDLTAAPRHGAPDG